MRIDRLAAARAVHANSGLQPGSLSLRASFSVAARPPGAELADLVQTLGDGRYRLPLAQALPPMQGAEVELAIRDQQGNITRLKRRFDTPDPGLLFADGFETAN